MTPSPLHPHSNKPGDRLTIGNLAARVLLAARGLFPNTRHGRTGDALTGAHAAHTTTLTGTQRAPMTDAFETFYCPIWPECGCTNASIHPDCPGLPQNDDGQMPPGWWIAPGIVLGILFWTAFIWMLM